MTCDCCGEAFVDEVGLMLIEEAVVAFRDEVLVKDRRDRAAWQDAEIATQRALQAARG